MVVLIQRFGVAGVARLRGLGPEVLKHRFRPSGGVHRTQVRIVTQGIAGAHISWELQVPISSDTGTEG